MRTGLRTHGLIRLLTDLGLPTRDYVIVGSGPNGLAAAIAIAQTGRKVVVFEAESTVGGGARSLELTLPGFTHDLCSAIHPFGAGSEFFRSVPLHEHGLEWIHSPAPVAHPLDDGSAAMLERSVEETAGVVLCQGAEPRGAVRAADRERRQRSVGRPFIQGDAGRVESQEQRVGDLTQRVVQGRAPLGVVGP